LRDVSFETERPGRDPLGWPGYEPRPAVRYGAGRIGGRDVVVAVWDFTTYGGSFGEAEATAFTHAASRAMTTRRPLVSLIRSGGTRMQEGMAALVGIPRAALALDELASARVPHVAVADQPTTGGVWVAVASNADLRVGVAGATVGFSGPRVVEAMTGQALPPTSHTAESAYAAGLLDGVVDPTEVETWIGRALRALAPHEDHGLHGEVFAPEPPESPDPPATTGWEQVRRSREAGRPDGARLLRAVLEDSVELGSADRRVTAAVGRSAVGRSTVGVALGSAKGARPGPAGYRLVERAAALANRLGGDLLLLVDTPGADPSAASEAGGIASAINAAMAAVLNCRTPTLAVVHGEGGSGGALAAATADAVLLTDTGYFAVLAPEGAAATLHVSPEDAANRIGLTPQDLIDLGFADAMVPGDPAQLRVALATHLALLGSMSDSTRFVSRRARWGTPLPGRIGG
jgi:acyl-CoA carboxylase subunit beta